MLCRHSGYHYAAAAGEEPRGRAVSMRVTHMLSLLLGCVILLPRVQSFASWFVKDYCSRKLIEGEIIMNNEALEDDSRSIKVFRNNQELQSDVDSYVSGEELIVTISDNSGGIQYVFETTPPAKFIGGGCENDVRIAPKTHAKLLIPTEYTDSIRVWGGWATGHEAVKLIKDFILLPPKSIGNINSDSTQLQNKKRKGLFHQNRTQPIVLTREKKRTMLEETIEAQRNKLRGSNHKHDINNMELFVYIVGMLVTFSVLHRLYINRFKIGRWYLKVRGYNFDE